MSTDTPPASFVDVDAFLNEIQGEAPVVRLMGRDWTLSPAMPTVVRLRLIRATAADEQLDEAETVDLIRAILGPEQTAELLAAGVTQTGLDALLLASMSAYRGLDGNETLAAFAQRINGTDTVDEAGDEAGKAPEDQGTSNSS